MERHDRLRGSCVALCLVLLMSGVAHAQAPQDDESSDVPPPETDPCRPVYGERPAAIDKVRGLVNRSVCATSLWFDGLFGDARAFEEAERSYGVIEAGGRWEERARGEAIGRVRVKWRFPALERRLKRRANLVFGRLPDERISREEPDPDGVAEELDRNEWVAGLDAAPVATRRHRVNVGVGVTYEDSLEPYIKLRSRSRFVLSETTGLRLLVTPYWQDGRREFGTRLTVDIDHSISARRLMRWTMTGIHDGTTEGTAYGAGVNFYHRFNDTWFMVNRLGVVGETRAEIPDRSYGIVTSVRRSVWREWLFVELTGGVDWRRETKAERRRSVLQTKLVFEMHFGDGPR